MVLWRPWNNFLYDDDILLDGEFRGVIIVCFRVAIHCAKIKWDPKGFEVQILNSSQEEILLGEVEWVWKSLNLLILIGAQEKCSTMNPNKNWNWFLFISALNIFRYLFWHINVQVQTVFSLKILVISRSSFLLNVIYYKSGQILIPFLSNLIRSKFLFNQPKYDPVFKKTHFFQWKRT